MLLIKVFPDNYQAKESEINPLAILFVTYIYKMWPTWCTDYNTISDSWINPVLIFGDKINRLWIQIFNFHLFEDPVLINGDFSRVAAINNYRTIAPDQ